MKEITPFFINRGAIQGVDALASGIWGGGDASTHH